MTKIQITTKKEDIGYSPVLKLYRDGELLDTKVFEPIHMYRSDALNEAHDLKDEILKKGWTE